MPFQYGPSKRRWEPKPTKPVDQKTLMRKRTGLNDAPHLLNPVSQSHRINDINRATPRHAPIDFTNANRQVSRSLGRIRLR